MNIINNQHMNAKEKAKELVDKFYYSKDEDGYHSTNMHRAKQCALIAVDEIINCDHFFKTLDDVKEFTKYWYEVQEEIKLL